jgi:hypothetical protein
MSDNKCLAAPAAAIRPGYQVGYVIHVDGKEIVSRGEVFSVRRTGHDMIEITLLHAKTGSLFTNELKATSPVLLTDITLNPKTGGGLVKKLMEDLMALLKEQCSDFYTIMPIED